MKQNQIPRQDCETICSLLDSIKGKLEGNHMIPPLSLMLNIPFRHHVHHIKR